MRTTTFLTLLFCCLSLCVFAQESVHRQCLNRIDYIVSETFEANLSPSDSACLEKANLFFSKIKRPTVEQQIYQLIGLHAKASINISQNRLREAVKDIEKAESILKPLKPTAQLSPDTITAYFYSLKSSLYFHQSEFQKTIDYSDQAISAFKKYKLYGKIAQEYLNKYSAVSIIGDKKAVQACLDSADFYLKKEILPLNKWRRATVPNFEETDPSVNTLLTEGLKSGAGVKEAWNAINRMAPMLGSLKGCSLPSAMTRIQLAMQYFLISVGSNDSVEVALAQDSSFSYAKQALECAEIREISKTIYESNIYTVAAYSFLGKQKYNEALYYTQRSLELLGQPKGVSRNLYESIPLEKDKINSKFLYFQSLITQAGILSVMYKKLGDFKYAYNAYLCVKNASLLTDDILMGLTTDPFMTNISDQVSLIYMGAAIASWRVHEFITQRPNDLPPNFSFSTPISYLEKAFQYAEQSKNFTLRQKLTVGKAEDIYNNKNTEGGIKKIYATEKKFRSQIALAETQAANKPAWIDTLRILRDQYSYFIQRLRLSSEKSDSMHYYKERYGKIPTIAEVQSQLSDSTAILEYVMIADEPLVFGITKHSATIKNLPSYKEWRGYLTHYLDPKKHWSTGSSDYLTTAHGLYKILLEDILTDSSFKNIKRLVIVSDGILREIAFETLLTDKFESKKPIPFLIRRYAISYQYALSTTPNERTIRTDKYQLGVFVAQPNDKSTCGKDTLPELEKLGKEQVAKWGNQGQLFINTDTATFKKEAPNYRFVQLILHGCVEGRSEPAKYGLQFSDTELKMPDIYNMAKFKPEMLLLTNCQSGAGQLNKAEGVISFAWAFAGRGIPSVIASISDIKDYQSAKLLGYFYKYLEEGKPKDIALQRAKIDYLSEKLHPQNWAPIICIGDITPIK